MLIVIYMKEPFKSLNSAEGLGQIGVMRVDDFAELSLHVWSVLHLLFPGTVH